MSGNVTGNDLTPAVGAGERECGVSTTDAITTADTTSTLTIRRIETVPIRVPLGRIYRGTMPFIAVDVVRLVILCAFPALSLWLPGHLQ